jgi:radical SAM superfamily enzyme YgiQ (UPF0313 family)
LFLGEGEEMIPEWMEVYRQEGSTGRRERDDLLRRLGGIEGVYIPKFYQVEYDEKGKVREVRPEAGFPPRIRRRWTGELDRFPVQSGISTPDTEFKEMALLEVNRGCPRKCRFCAACFVYHPYRNRSLPLLESLSKESLSREPRIGLTGTAVSDYPHLLPLCRSILSSQGGISLGSLRIDAVSPPLVQCLQAGKDRTVAIAPEAGSERLRRVIRKGYGEEEILDAVRILVENGLYRIKCYFLIGLPTETDDDVRAILHLAKKIRHVILSNRKERKETWRLVLSVNPFIPKPATPFQWAPMEEVGQLKRKLKMLQKGVSGEKGIELIHDLPKWSYVQTLLSRGDRRVGSILRAVHQRGGDWGRALRETDLNPDFYVYRQRDLDETFPWDLIDHGIPKEKLKDEYLKAMGDAETAEIHA